MFAGRKKDSGVWKYFEQIGDKSECLVKVEVKNVESQCGVQLAGKNTSNLRVFENYVTVMLLYAGQHVIVSPPYKLEP
jgi:hypothetical protein